MSGGERQHAGQTVLHYAYVYGFDELATYLKGKGADDTLRNMCVRLSVVGGLLRLY
jgi:hypothetical protein